MIRGILVLFVLCSGTWASDCGNIREDVTSSLPHLPESFIEIFTEICHRDERLAKDLIPSGAMPGEHEVVLVGGMVIRLTISQKNGLGIGRMGGVYGARWDIQEGNFPIALKFTQTRFNDTDRV